MEAASRIRAGGGVQPIPGMASLMRGLYPGAVKTAHTTRIRDPIHGSVLLDARERRVIDAPFFQRLRWVRQMGFADAAFPGATHTRYVHALGACHVSGRIFDSMLRHLPRLPDAERNRLRAALRLAVLLHDLGHPPFSHSSESILPDRSVLGLPSWLRSEDHTSELQSRENIVCRLLLAKK